VGKIDDDRHLAQSDQLVAVYHILLPITKHRQQKSHQRIDDELTRSINNKREAQICDHQSNDTSHEAPFIEPIQPEQRREIKTLDPKHGPYGREIGIHSTFPEKYTEEVIHLIIMDQAII
jgi:hypothetical protein